MKDNVPVQAEVYTQFRPHYPEELFLHLFSLLAEKNTAWVCGTGNGRVAVVLADHCNQVNATKGAWDNIATHSFTFQILLRVGR